MSTASWYLSLASGFLSFNSWFASGHVLKFISYELVIIKTNSNFITKKVKQNKLMVIAKLSLCKAIVKDRRKLTIASPYKLKVSMKNSNICSSCAREKSSNMQHAKLQTLLK